MYSRHEASRDAHARMQPLPPTGLLAAFRRPSYEAARGAWEKAARALQRRSRQLVGRMEHLKSYLGRVTGQRHRGDELARRKVERAHPDLTRLYEAVMRGRQIAHVRQQEREREQTRQRERGRDDRGRGR
jgi:hypothetical protein